MVDERAGGRGLCLHVGDHELEPLELGDRLAELLPLSRVSDRVVERALGDPQRLGGDPGAGAVEHPHRDAEALALLAEPVLGGDDHVVEVQLGGVAAADPELAVDGRRGEPGRVLHVDDEGADPLAACAGCSTCENDDGIRDSAVGDPDLRSAQDVVVSTPDGAGHHPSGVAARARLGERVGGELAAAGQVGEPSLLLGVGAGEDDRVAAQRLDGEDERARGADLGDLLDGDVEGQGAPAQPAVLGGEGQGEEVLLAEQLDHVPGELLGLVDLRRPGGDASARQLADRPLHHQLLLVEADVHGRLPLVWLSDECPIMAAVRRGEARGR